MREYTIEIASERSAYRDDDQLVDVTEALRGGPALGGVVAADTATGVIDARFQVKAINLAEAVHVGVHAFETALAAAGVQARAGSVSADGEPVAA